ncbi:MAG: 23S rRNA (uracil-5-)-methyltransferase RumA [Clostridiales bacterium 38-18]|nr:MAG: 23S rRNA (uracil-5-)-methyltransferase RumA [Clostridiales bacterium 38-18]
MELAITDIGESGEGVGKFEGMTVFVEGAQPGDTVKCRVYEQKKTYSRAKTVEIIKPSKFRIVPPCPVYEACGGCQIQEIEYQQQLKLKESMVNNAVKRIGGVDLESAPIIGMKQPFRYRNKGVYQIQGTSEQPKIGFFRPKSHDVVDVKDCLLQDEINAKIVDVIRKYMKDFKVEPYNVAKKKGTLISLMIRKSETTGEIMVVLVTASNKLAMTKTLVELLKAVSSNIVSIIQSVKEHQGIKGLGDHSKVLYGKSTISDAIEDLSFEISAESFYQVNAKQTKQLYQKVLEFAALTGEETVCELYSGTGTISLFLGKRAKRVFGVEIVPEAVENANSNAKRNGLENVTFIEGDAHNVISDLSKTLGEDQRIDVVVVDPPRSGCDEGVIKSIKEMNPERVVYVSCKPSTLSRDIKRLTEDGQYQLKQIQAVDVFCQTAHVESVVLLTKVN